MRFYTSRFCQVSSKGINAYTSSGTDRNNQCVFMPKFALGKVNRTYDEMITTDCKPSTELLTKGGERRATLPCTHNYVSKGPLKALTTGAHRPHVLHQRVIGFVRFVLERNYTVQCVWLYSTYCFVSYISCFLKPDFWNIQGQINHTFFFS